jgi:hypothetical protein
LSDQIQKTTVIAVYSAGVAACYLAGFWGRFDLNIFQFAGLTGFASMALYPLMTAIGLNLLASLVATSHPPIPRVTQDWNGQQQPAIQERLPCSQQFTRPLGNSCAAFTGIGIRLVRISR